ncbi:MAG: amidohydrolase family protein [Clostridia bacterium]|nr:amidohydrolase family protein [Clostridia bacterium]
MIIDSHTHIYPEKIAEKTVKKLSGFTGLNPSNIGTAGDLKRMMKETGVDVSLILPVATNPEKVDRLNDFAVSVNCTDSLVSLGAMHPDCEYWEAELERLSSLGFKGIKIHPVYQGVDIDDIRYLRIFDKAAQLGLAVVTHAGFDIGFPGEQRCMPRQIANAVKAVGNYKLIAAHMGGWEDWDEAMYYLAGTSVYIDTSFALSIYNYNNNELRSAEIKAAFGETGNFNSQSKFLEFIKAFGAQRILFGSDAPWDSPMTNINFINSLPIENSEKELIFSGNASRIFNI